MQPVRARASLSTLLLVLAATAGAGCAPHEATTFDGEFEASPLVDDDGALLHDAVLTVAGRVAARVDAVRHDAKTGEVSLTFVDGASAELLDLLARAIGGEEVDAPDLVLIGLDDDEAVVEITLLQPLMKEVSFDELTASDGKAMFRCTTTFEADEIHRASDATMPTSTDVASWTAAVRVPGLDPKAFDGFSLTLGESAKPVGDHVPWTAERLMVTGSPESFASAEALVAAARAIPVTIELIDGTTGRRTTMVVHAKPVKATRKPLQSTIEWAIEQQTINISQKA